MKNYVCKSTLLWVVLTVLSMTKAFSQPVGWTYYTPITITNTGSAISNSPVKIYVNTAAMISAGHMQANGSDLRFGSACNGDSSYSFCIDSGINSTHTMMHVKMNIAAGATKTVYMFYGNPAASSAIDPTICIIWRLRFCHAWFYRWFCF
ncbi:MAG: DUF2341 domain-containing protein [Bacteroidota bacterium]